MKVVLMNVRQQYKMTIKIIKDSYLLNSDTFLLFKYPLFNYKSFNLNTTL